MSDKTGVALSEEILKKIEQEGLDIKNCQWQSYDNDANMAGKYQEVQARISETNHLAKFVPCAAHTLNFVGVNAATAVQDVAENSTKIDIVSKLLQKEDTAIDVARNLLKGLTAQIKDRRGAIVNEVLEEAKQSCLALNVDPYFKKVRKRKKKRFFDEKCKDESSEISQHKKFKLALLQGNDRIKAELERRF
ncbi:hypothetical protein AVEN_20759-1 [Araneus ventricosus]|uniref:DUF4371 domain-containing protein n=1 Tax=Araneus ventricosus TaxID=182803 RepID=A0A4Y2WND5_ARAVE|nr:hypothetical protein AVEN_20759-1 [Araneus ventricosus]